MPLQRCSLLDNWGFTSLCRADRTSYTAHHQCVGTCTCLLIAFIAVQVGSLLLVFLPASLSEQIRARKFFNKSGRLVKDSIITLSDSSFSRDVTDQVISGAALAGRVCQQAWLALLALTSPSVERA